MSEMRKCSRASISGLRWWSKSGDNYVWIHHLWAMWSIVNIKYLLYNAAALSVCKSTDCALQLTSMTPSSILPSKSLLLSLALSMASSFTITASILDTMLPIECSILSTRLTSLRRQKALVPHYTTWWTCHTSTIWGRQLELCENVFSVFLWTKQWLN